MEGYIYIISNRINDKFYIGSTKQSIKKRFSGHKQEAKWYSSLPMYADMIKYGSDKFEINVLTKVTVKDRYELCQIEGDYQEKFNPPYNKIKNHSTKEIQRIRERNNIKL
jgi:group I intron endonuclease